MNEVTLENLAPWLVRRDLPGRVRMSDVEMMDVIRWANEVELQEDRMRQNGVNRNDESDPSGQEKRRLMESITSTISYANSQSRNPIVFETRRTHLRAVPSP
jgi:hypothetical protein